MSDQLTKYERETQINFNMAENTAIVYTSDPAWIRQLDALSQEDNRVIVKWRRDEFVEYELPKEWVKVPKPKRVNMTDEQKAAAAERLKAARAKKKMQDNEVQYDEVQVQEEIA